MYQRLKYFVKAQLSAFIGGVCDYFIMIALTEFGHIHYAISIIIACLLGSVINFTINKTWSFYNKEQKYSFNLPQQLFRFVIVVLSSIMLKSGGTLLLTELSGLDYRISRVAIDLIVSLGFNYVLQRYWVFRKVRRNQTTQKSEETLIPSPEL
ncbi:MAG: GtrA family protein [Bacteroidales bacterium]|jgi:putative flippase GtrA|nr:GtrA family protein [Bacteroidales bacterium]